MGFLRAACVEGLGVAMLPLEVAAVSDGGEPALVRVMPRYSFSGGGMYVMWPSQKLVPARVAAVREALIAELSALFADPR